MHFFNYPYKVSFMTKIVQQNPAKLPAFTVDGGMWLSFNDSLQMNDRRIDLLEQIDKGGSITQAAKNVGLSYKGAWDNLEAMRNSLGVPLLVSEIGGKGGGGSRLTPEAKRIVNLYRLMQTEHARFLKNLDQDSADFESGIQLLRRLTMKTSARNQYFGKVSAIHPGAVNAEVEVTLDGGEKLFAVITQESVTGLDLAVGKEVWALVKASWVIITPALAGMKLSARNQLSGVVSRITDGAVNADVVVTLKGGATISAIVTSESLKEMGLKEGDPACAVFKAPSVILGVQS